MFKHPKKTVKGAHNSAAPAPKLDIKGVLWPLYTYNIITKGIRNEGAAVREILRPPPNPHFDLLPLEKISKNGENGQNLTFFCLTFEYAGWLHIFRGLLDNYCDC